MVTQHVSDTFAQRRILARVTGAAGITTSVGLLAGTGSVLARAIWTEGIAFVPFTAFWLWAAVMSVLLLRGRFVERGIPR